MGVAELFGNGWQYFQFMDGKLQIWSAGCTQPPSLPYSNSSASVRRRLHSSIWFRGWKLPHSLHLSLHPLLPSHTITCLASCSEQNPSSSGQAPLSPCHFASFTGLVCVVVSGFHLFQDKSSVYLRLDQNLDPPTPTRGGIPGIHHRTSAVKLKFNQRENVCALPTPCSLHHQT